MRTAVAKLGKYAVAAVIAVLTGPGSALADSFALTSGSFFFTRFDNATITISSLDQSIGVYMGGADARKYDPPYICGTECSGRTINLSASDSLTRTPDSDNNVVGGIFEVGGTMYFVDSIVYSIVAGSIVAPVEGPASTWFRFAATMTGTTNSGLSRALELSGGGSATASWNSRYGWVATNYKLESPATVPEPASLLLFGSGLAAVGGLRRRRAQR